MLWADELPAHCPVVALLGGSDEIVCSAAVRQYLSAVPTVDLIWRKGGRHGQILFDKALQAELLQAVARAAVAVTV